MGAPSRRGRRRAAYSTDSRIQLKPSLYPYPYHTIPNIHQSLPLHGLVVDIQYHSGRAKPGLQRQNRAVRVSWRIGTGVSGGMTDP